MSSAIPLYYTVFRPHKMLWKPGLNMRNFIHQANMKSYMIDKYCADLQISYNKVCYRWLHSALHVKRETRILPIGGRCLQAQILPEPSHSLPKYLYRLITLQFAVRSFYTMKLCGKLLMVFSRNFCEERQIWAFEPHFGEVRDDARHWLTLDSSLGIPSCPWSTFYLR